MGGFFQHNFNITINPPLPQNAQIAVNVSPLYLLNTGFNIPIEISTASIFRRPPNPAPLASIIVMAHFDTGASITSIDINLAKHLKLAATGQSTSHTAAGPQLMPNFAVDIGFPNTGLSPFINLKIGSCKLNFDIQKGLNNPNDPKNFGVLLGRDVMSRWNIVWNGPSSTVFISD
jgi:hypothetical protein